MASAARTVRRGRALLPLPRRRWHHPDPLNPSTKGWRSAVKEGDLPTKGWEAEIARGLELGLPAASSIVDRDIPTFSRGELPHFAGINTFMKAPYLEDVRLVGNYDAAVMGVPYDGGTTYRSGTRFGPQGIRRISALYSPYNYELGVDLREQMTLCARAAQFSAQFPAQFGAILRRRAPKPAGSAQVRRGRRLHDPRQHREDVRPDLERGGARRGVGLLPHHPRRRPFDRLPDGARAGVGDVEAHRYAMGRAPDAAGRRRPPPALTPRAPPAAGIIHFDRHADIQETDLDERMHTTPYFHATAIPNVRPENLVQIGIGGWQARRAPRCPLVARVTRTVLTASLPRAIAGAARRCADHARPAHQHLLGGGRRGPRPRQGGIERGRFECCVA